MTNFFLSLFEYFNRHKALMYVLMIVTSLVFVVFGSQIKFEEDISKLLGKNDENAEEQLVFESLKVKDKIFIQFTAKDGTEVDYETLAAACDAFSDSLLTRDTATSYIADLTWQLDEMLLYDGISYLYQHLPVIFTEPDYAVLDSLCSDACIAQAMQDNFEDVQSATGMYSFELVRQDPLRLRNGFKNKASMASSALGGSYRIIDGHFYTRDSSSVVAFLSPNFTGFDSKVGTKLVKQIERGIAETEAQFDQVQVLFHGAPIQSVFNSRQIKEDLVLTIGISLTLALVLIFLCFKNKSTILMLLAPIGYGVFFSLFCIWLIKDRMSLMAIGLGAIVLGVALSYCLHLLTHYKYVSDPKRVLREQTKPVILGCLTTIGAFMGLLFIDSELLNDFGMFATFSLIGTTTFGLVFLPHFMKPEGNRRSDRAFRWMDKVNSYPIDRKPVFVAAIALISVVCIAFSWKVEFDPDLKNIGYHNPKVVESSRLLAEKTSNGMDAVYFASAGSTLDEALAHNQAFARTLDSAYQAGLIHQYARTADLLLPSAVQQARIDRWNDFWTPGRKAAVKTAVDRYGKRYGFTEEVFEPFFELLDSQFEPEDMTESGVIPEALMANWIEKVNDRYMVFTQVQMPYGIRDEVCDRILTKGGHSMVIDPFYYTQDMAKVLNDDFSTVLLISSIFVFIVLVLSFRNLLLCFIAFLPMGLSWYIVQGVMVFLGLKFNLINIIISAFIFGVGVDYSIFIMDGLLAESRNKGRLLIQHKAAILLSAIVLIISVSSLIFATHPSLKSTGITTLIGMSATIVIAYTFEPFLFHYLCKFQFFKNIIAKHNDTFKPNCHEV